jgi:hypothetical protein
MFTNAIAGEGDIGILDLPGTTWVPNLEYSLQWTKDREDLADKIYGPAFLVDVEMQTIRHEKLKISRLTHPILNQGKEFTGFEQVINGLGHKVICQFIEITNKTDEVGDYLSTDVKCLDELDNDRVRESFIYIYKHEGFKTNIISWDRYNNTIVLLYNSTEIPSSPVSSDVTTEALSSSSTSEACGRINLVSRDAGLCDCIVPKIGDGAEAIALLDWIAQDKEKDDAGFQLSGWFMTSIVQDPTREKEMSLLFREVGKEKGTAFMQCVMSQ